MKVSILGGAAALALALTGVVAIADDSSSAVSSAASDVSSAVSSASSDVSSTVSSASSDVSSAVSSASSDVSSAVSSASSSLDEGTDNWGQLISAIQTGATADLSVITDSTNVRFVTVSSLKANGQTNALDNALKKNAAALTTLRTNVSANAALSAKLSASNYTASQVVAVTTGADGTVTVYIDDRG